MFIYIHSMYICSLSLYIYIYKQRTLCFSQDKALCFCGIYLPWRRLQACNTMRLDREFGTLGIPFWRDQLGLWDCGRAPSYYAEDLRSAWLAACPSACHGQGLARRKICFFQRWHRWLSLALVTKHDNWYVCLNLVLKSQTKLRQCCCAKSVFAILQNNILFVMRELLLLLRSPMFNTMTLLCPQRRHCCCSERGIAVAPTKYITLVQIQ